MLIGEQTKSAGALSFYDSHPRLFNLLPSNQPSDARQIRPAGGARQDSGTNKSAQLASPLKTRSVAVETLDYTDR